MASKELNLIKTLKMLRVCRGLGLRGLKTGHGIELTKSQSSLSVSGGSKSLELGVQCQSLALTPT